MEELASAVSQLAEELGIQVCVQLSPELLVPEQRIRDLCHENKCGNYRAHYMCPPYVGTVEEIRARLSGYHLGLLLQYSQPLDVRNDPEGVKRTEVDFHGKVLMLEELLRAYGAEDAWGLIGGSCALCEPCKAASGEPCRYPEEARPSLESLAIDVLALLARFDLDNEFHPDRITWTGCVLIG